MPFRRCAHPGFSTCTESRIGNRFFNSTSSAPTEPAELLPPPRPFSSSYCSRRCLDQEARTAFCSEAGRRFCLIGSINCCYGAAPGCQCTAAGRSVPAATTQERGAASACVSSTLSQHQSTLRIIPLSPLKSAASWGLAFRKQPRKQTCTRCEQSAGDTGGVFGYGALQGRKVLHDKAVASALIGASPDEAIYVGTKTTNRKGDDLVEELSQRPELADAISNNGSSAPLETPMEKEAWALLREAVVTYCGQPVGTIAANDPTDPYPLNYDQVFIRDFIPSAIAFLLKGEYDIVRNFIHHTLQLQSWEKTVDCYTPGQGLMPASFKVQTVYLEGEGVKGTEEILHPDFGEAAIGRVAPVDSGLWWIILLRAYGKCTGDLRLQERVDVQTGIKMILKVCLADGFDMFPSLLVTDGSMMIDRRMGIHGHPLEIQALFYHALRCAKEMLNPEAQDLIRLINSRLAALSFHIQEYYWLDIRKLNEIYRYRTEEYSSDAVNKFNIYPDQISQWLLDWLPEKGGYFIGNLQPAHMDFRWFALGNIWSINGALATSGQAEDILALIESKWEDLIGTMPLKICYPALAEDEWRIITGADPKNTAWSYHNGGSWPVLLWQFTVACIKMDRSDLAEKAIAIAEKRLSRDWWPEYYDTKSGRFIGKQARLYQTWSIAGYLCSKLMLRNPETAKWLTCEEDDDTASISCVVDNMNPRRNQTFNMAPDTFIV